MTLDVGRAVALSLQVGLGATALGFFPALAAAWALSRGRFPGKALLNAALSLPLVLPPVVVGLGLLRLFGRGSPLGAALAAAGLPVTFSLLGALLAALVVGAPLYVSTMRQALDAVDPRYEAVSATLGVGPWRTFWRITAPLSAPGLAAGAVLAFARGLGEFGATVVIAGNMEGRTRTIALAIYSLLDVPGEDPRLGQLAAASVGLAVLTVGAAELLRRAQRARLGLDDGPGAGR